MVMRHASDPALERLARRLFMEEWRRLADDGQAEESALSGEYCPIPWLIRELVRLAQDPSLTCPTEIEQAVRHLAQTMDFVDPAGDRITSARHQAMVHRCTQALIHAASRLRAYLSHAGPWADLPVPPLMFG
ncbi:MAG TPA: hypothetical protein VF184_03315 [Phycisphaeraceae bacterium]